MKTKQIEFCEEDVITLNKIKKFLNTPDSELDEKELVKFNKLMKWVNRWFYGKEIDRNTFMGMNLGQKKCEATRKQEECHCGCENKKMGKGGMRGLSGLWWDFSKMPVDEAAFMRECLERDREHDRMLHPWKYGQIRRPMKMAPMIPPMEPHKKPAKFENKFNPDFYQHINKDDKKQINRVLRQIAKFLVEILEEESKEDPDNPLNKIGEIL